MKRFFSVVLVLTTVFLCSCKASEAKGELSAMDTYMSFKLYGSNSEAALGDIKELVTKTDKKLSATDTNSEIYKLNTDGSARLSADSLHVVKRSLELCAELAPALDITVYPVVKEWGFISGEYKIPEKETLDKLSTKVDFEAVKVDGDTATLKKGAEVDLGAVAKGFLADESKAVLMKNNVDSALLNFGGTIFAYGEKPDGTDWKVGIANPENRADYFGYLSCNDKVVATSGGYERYFLGDDGKKYIHIIDPATGCPVDNGLSSVSIASADGTAADALSTALYVMGAEKAVEYYKNSDIDFDFIMLKEDGKLLISERISNDFVLKDGFDAEMKVIKK